jgi:hypothetical protein
MINIDVLMEGERVETGLAGVTQAADTLLEGAFRFTPGEYRSGKQIMTRLNRDLERAEGYTIPSDQASHLLDGLVSRDILERKHNDPTGTKFTYITQMVKSRTSTEAQAAGYM